MFDKLEDVPLYSKKLGNILFSANYCAERIDSTFDKPAGIFVQMSEKINVEIQNYVNVWKFVQKLQILKNSSGHRQSISISRSEKFSIKLKRIY